MIRRRKRKILIIMNKAIVVAYILNEATKYPQIFNAAE